MKTKSILLLVTLIALFVGAISYHAISQDSSGKKILYYSCPMHPDVKSANAGSCPQCGMSLQPVYASDNIATNPMPPMGTSGTNSAAAAQPTPYPLKTCVVSGETLGEMGPPIEFVYTNNGANQEIKFCCPMCKPKFLKDPGPYMKKIKAAEAKTETKK